MRAPLSCNGAVPFHRPCRKQQPSRLAPRHERSRQRQRSLQTHRRDGRERDEAIAGDGGRPPRGPRIVQREVEVIGHLGAALDAEGSALASGAAEPFRMNGSLRQRWLRFRSGGHFCMATRHPEIVDAARSNDIYIGGLASESWSRLLTDF